MSPRGFRPPGAQGSRPLRIGPQQPREAPPSIRRLAGAVLRTGLRALGRKLAGRAADEVGDAIRARLSPEAVTDAAALETIRHLAQPGFRVVVMISPASYHLRWLTDPRSGYSSAGPAAGEIVAWGSGPTLIDAVDKLQQSADRYLRSATPDTAPAEPAHVEAPRPEGGA